MDRASLSREERWRIADYLAGHTRPSGGEALRPVRSIYSVFVKRLLDILIGGFAFILTLPVNAVLAVCTFFDVGRPIFFRQERTGRNGKPFYIVKFRNMTNRRDERGELLPAAQRVTPFGRFVRKTSLDELLNFWSVLKGDMSLIGPRPLVPEYAARYSDRHAGRLLVRPGLECPPAKGHALVTWQDQFENDVWYVEHVSFLTDVKLVFRLIAFAFDRKNAEARAGVSGKGIFMGYSPEGRAVNLEEVSDEIIEKALADGETPKEGRPTDRKAPKEGRPAKIKEGS